VAANPDPYRTLGLAPGASIEEIRRAYRRLAKANHPDSAGEAALPRFLAIQAAYEVLVDAKLSRLPGARPGATARPAPREPWRADPDRARATRDGAGRRGARPGRRPGPGAGEPPPGPTDGPSAAPGGDGSTRAEGRADGRGAGRSRKRPSNKATLGSTSYDAAEDEPFEPEWSGGTWYGASSGTYWTINPKEYADPRKHGPEYQRRARAAAGEGGEIDEPSPTAAEEPLTSHEPPDASFGAEEPPAPPTPPADPAADVSFEPLIPGLRDGFAGRIGLALVGWPAIGFAISAIGGEVTGCGRFAAGCVEPFGIGTWIAQLAIITILIALPRLAFVSAVGTLAALAASVPTAVALSATGGSREPAASGAILAGVLAIAYLAGAALAIVRRGRFSRVP